MHRFINSIFVKYPVKTRRFLEILPPFIALWLLSMPFWGSVLFPVQLAYFIIFFDVYWFYKSINLCVCSFIASRKIQETERHDWLSEARVLPGFRKLKHVVIIPTYKESVEKLRCTLESLKGQTIPQRHLYVCMAMEEREAEAYEKAELLKRLNKGQFGGLFFTFHPDRREEVRGKSSNQAYAARKIYQILVAGRRFDIRWITVSSVDADSLFDPQYFAHLSYKFLTSSTPHATFWQSANVHYSNFWQVPVFTRIISFFGSLWRTSLLVQGMRLIPNSTYSLSLLLLKKIGYWDTDVIPEDYRVFFKAFFKMGGKVGIEPLYLRTSMDAPLSKTYVKSLLNKYHQERRWSWGISDDALYIKWWCTLNNVPFFKKTYLVANVLLDHILWPVNWFLITISANVVVFLNPIFSRTALGYNLPRLSGFILTLCLLALLFMMGVDFHSRAKYHSHVSKVRQLLFPLEFVFMPIAGFFLSSLPALISHIHLILGKRLEYKVTEKA